MDPIKLDYPIDLEGRKLTEITLRRPKVKEARDARKKHKDEADQEISLLATLSGLPPSAIEDLDIADYTKLQKELAGFFGSSETTASEPS